MASRFDLSGRDVYQFFSPDLYFDTAQTTLDLYRSAGLELKTLVESLIVVRAARKRRSKRQDCDNNQRHTD